MNFSEVSGPTPEAILKSLDLPTSDFYATGVSIVIHPVNPWVPIIHMNVRYFEMSDGTRLWSLLRDTKVSLSLNLVVDANPAIDVSTPVDAFDCFTERSYHLTPASGHDVLECVFSVFVF